MVNPPTLHLAIATSNPSAVRERLRGFVAVAEDATPQDMVSLAYQLDDGNVEVFLGRIAYIFSVPLDESNQLPTISQQEIMEAVIFYNGLNNLPQKHTIVPHWYKPLAGVGVLALAGLVILGLIHLFKKSA